MYACETLRTVVFGTTLAVATGPSRAANGRSSTPQVGLRRRPIAGRVSAVGYRSAHGRLPTSLGGESVLMRTMALVVTTFVVVGLAYMLTIGLLSR